VPTNNKKNSLVMFDEYTHWATKVIKTQSKKYHWPYRMWSEIHNAGLVGLWKAVLAYDGIHPFKVYAIIRITGEIRDELRRLNQQKFVPLDFDIIHEHKKFVDWNLTPKQEHIIKLLSQGYTLKEIGKSMGVTQGRVWQMVRDRR